MSINSVNLSCPSCKATNPAHARFCQNCGKSMFADADTVNQSVSDQTGRPMAADFVYAGFWKRVFAYWIDAIVFGLLFSVIAVLSLIGKTSFTPDDAEQLALFYASFYLGWWMYFALMESSSGQATIGKRAIGIKVTDMQGQGLSFMHAAGRQLSGVVSSLTFTIGYLLAAFSGRKQALHDMIAGTVVVNKNFGPSQITLINQSPPPGMSIGAIIGVIFLVLVVPVGGILAAIAIPAYSHYVTKASVLQTYDKAIAAGPAIVDYASQSGYWPVNFEQAQIDSSSMRSDDYFMQLKADGVIEIHFVEPQIISGSLLRLTPDMDNQGNYYWHCSGVGMDTKYLPPRCQ